MFKTFFKSKEIYNYISKSPNYYYTHYYNKLLYHHETTQKSNFNLKSHKSIYAIGLISIGAILAFTCQYNHLLTLADDTRIKYNRTKNIPKFKEWLLKQDADFEKIDFIKQGINELSIWTNHKNKIKPVMPLFIRKAFGWTQEFNIASFPLKTLKINKDSIITDKLFGSHFETIKDEDESNLVILYLMFHMKLDKISHLKPWIDVLPKEFEMPIYYNEKQLNELKGTSLYKATLAMEKSLKLTWTKFEPFIKKTTYNTGMIESPSYDDFKWANCIYWSRSMEIPDKLGNYKIVIIPGLDFCNHSFKPNSRFELDDFKIKLMYKTCDFNELKELSVNYGIKSNEELLFSYGFVIDDNPHDKLMLNFPLPNNPNDITEIEKLRYLYLAKQNLMPQFFLPSKIKLNNDINFKNLFSDDIWKICETYTLTEEELKIENKSNTIINREKEILLIIINLLKQKLEEMENGTGSYRDDIEKLKNTNNKWLKNCLIYRSVQKELTKDWLEIAHIYLEQINNK